MTVAATAEKSLQRDHDSQRLTLKRFRSMTLANSVLHQQAIPWTKKPLVPLARRAFDFASQDNKQLAPG